MSTTTPSQLEGYRKFLLRLARQQIHGRLRSKVSESDIVQSTMLQAYDNFEGFRGASDQELRGSLAKILHSQCINEMKKYVANQKRDVRRELPDLSQDLEAFLSDQPIQARSLTCVQRVANWLRRPERVSEFGLGLMAINLLVLGWAAVNYPVVMVLFPGSTTDTQTRDLFLPVVCLIIPVHGFMLWSSHRIHRQQLSRNVAIVHLTATILMALVSITVVCLTSESKTLDMNRFERVATLGLMSTFAELQALGVLVLLLFSPWPQPAKPNPLSPARRRSNSPLHLSVYDKKRTLV